MKLTQEQQDIVDAVVEQQDGIISVNARAGSGKSHSCNAIAKAVQPRNGFYTAFNRAIVQDSEKRFGDIIECRTIHALGYRNMRPTLKIKDMSYDDIEEEIENFNKREVIDAIDTFYLSRHLNLDDFFREHEVQPELQNICYKYINKMLDGKMNPTFNFLLKVLHYDLATGARTLHKDLLIGDEQQDSTEVAFEIFKLIDSPKKVILGDKYQNIYGFMNTINVFDVLKDSKQMHLTKSFRCSPFIAERVEKFGQKFLEEDFRFSGYDGVEPDESIVYLTRTNAFMILQIMELMNEGLCFKLIKSISEVFATPISILMASQGKQVYKESLKFLEREYEKLKLDYGIVTRHDYFQDLKENFYGDREIMSAVILLERLSKSGINIFELKKKVEEVKPCKERIISTAHSFKGLEAGTVYICNDLNTSMSDSIGIRSLMSSKEIQEERNLYYVSLSRAKHQLVGAIHVI